MGRLMSKTAPEVDLVHVLPLLGMLVLVFIAAAINVVRRWRGAGDVDRALWSPQQIAAARHWRISLGIVLIAGWACLAVALIHHALQPEVAALLPRTIGPMQIPDWFALAIHTSSNYHGLWYMLFATGVWVAECLDRRDRPPRPFKPVYGFICFLAAASIVADATCLSG